jgi:glucokinase
VSALGIDVGGSSLKLAVLQGDEVTATHRVPLPDSDVTGFIVRAAVEAAAQHRATSIGLGLAGLVDRSTGTLVWGPHLHGTSVPYGDLMSSALDVEVAVDNDANLAALAEWSIGSGDGADPLLTVMLGSGIGLGLVTGGRVYRGAAFAGEAGHMTVVDGGEACACGRSGCWETVVSGGRFDRLAVELLGPRLDGSPGAPQPTGRDLARAAEAGDVGAQRAIGEAGRWLGRGLVQLVLMVDPERIVVGGGGAGVGGNFLAEASETLTSSLPGARYRPVIPIVPARFGEWSGAVGAALGGRRVQNGDHDW